MYYDHALERVRRGTLVGQVMGLLAFSMAFTAGGAIIGPRLGVGGWVLGIVGSLACVLILAFARARLSSGLALGIFYLFSVFEGMFLGTLIESYLARGLGGVVVNAAMTTAALTLALGAYAWTTKRDLSGMGTYLMAGLLAILLAGLTGLVLRLFGMQLGIFSLVLAIASAVLFSGFVVYDLQRLKNADAATDDPIMLAIGIYLSIFNLFISILQILGFLNNEE